MALEFLNNPQASLVVSFVSLWAGYAGADVAPTALIDRILWPQRAYNGLNFRNILKNALLLPAGGPLHRTALAAIDTFFSNSLHKGAGRGHMLGTAFFPDTGLKYKIHPSNGEAVQEEYVRNGLLVRAIQWTGDREGSIQDANIGRRLRQCITVSHLQLFSLEDPTPRSNAIVLDAGSVNAKTLVGIIASETLALLLAFGVASYWQSFAAIIWLVPLALKILAALTTVPREDLIVPNEKRKLLGDEPATFEIHVPGEGFQVISGPAELILPFFRHYGHPIRCRWREIVQMLIVAAMGLYFPITLIVSFIYLPVRIQAVWTTYQIYLVAAMLVARLGGGSIWGTTEECVGQALAAAEKHGRNGAVTLMNEMGELIGARMQRTVHGSYSDGKAYINQIVVG